MTKEEKHLSLTAIHWVLTHRGVIKKTEFGNTSVMGCWIIYEEAKCVIVESEIYHQPYYVKIVPIEGGYDIGGGVNNAITIQFEGNETLSSEEAGLVKEFLDRNLSEVERFRKTLIKEIEGDFTDNFRWRTVTEHLEAIKTTRRIVDIIKDFKLP